jgi:hypothetical protein
LKPEFPIYHTILSALLSLVGVALVVLAFFNEPITLQLALGFIGLGFLVLSIVPLMTVRRRDQAEERFDRLMAKLGGIHETLKNLEEKPQKSGIAIADLFGSGLKLYQDYVNRDKEDKEKDSDA